MAGIAGRSPGSTAGLREGSRYEIKAIGKAMQVLDCFTPCEPWRTAPEISQALGLNIATTYRILTSLERAGLVYRDGATRRYTLGLKIRELAARNLWHGELQLKARSYLYRLRSACSETVILYTLAEESFLICLDVLESEHEVRRIARLGFRRRLGLGATSHVFYLALLERYGLRFLRAVLDEVLEETAATPEQVLAAVRELRQRGFALTVDGRFPGISAVSAPIRDASGEVVAALTVSGPGARLQGNALFEAGRLVAQATSQLSRELGFDPGRPA